MGLDNVKDRLARQHRPRWGILVVGGYQCGLSAVARSLNLMGAALPGGPSEQPTGLWDSADIIAAHDGFLAAIGSAWDDPFPLPQEAFSTRSALACHDELLDILHRDVAEAPVFAIKDPRLCRLLPLWQSVLGSFGARPMAVLPVRHPLEAALSLRLRHGMPREKGLALWLTHTLAAERGSRAWPRAFVSFDAILRDPIAAAWGMAERLQCFAAADVAAALPAIAGFISNDLRHHKLAPPSGEERLSPTWLRDTYGWVFAAAAGGEPAHAPLDAVAAALDAATQIFGPLLSSHRPKPIAEVARQVNIVQRDALADRVDELANRLQQSEAALVAMSGIATSLHGQIPAAQRLGGLVRAALRGRLRQRLAEDRDIATISRAGLFDPAYYFSRYPDVATARIDPLIHYVRCGAREGRDPHPAFDSHYYWTAYPDVAAGGINPLAHYAKCGAAEGRRPNGGKHAASDDKPFGLEPLLAARLFKGGPAQAAAPVSPRPPASAPAGNAFPWLTADDRAGLSALFDRYGFGQGDAGFDEKAALAAVAKGFARLPAGPSEVSIVIPVHNQLRHTLACLESLALWPSKRPIEVLIGDDASTDGTAARLAGIPGIRVLRSEVAGGFIDNCNRTAAEAVGRYLLLLNNDTLVLPGAIDALIDSFDDHPDCGLVGCRLLYPDGRLQEAGGIVWADGSGWNFGRLDDPRRPEYSFLRDVDYCSGAAIALPTELWRSLGGFDTHYRPAYFEDTDLAYRVRAAGRRVLYQPEATVIHFEGVSNGTSEEGGGLKRFQRENRPKFVARWQAEIAGNGMPDARPANFADRSSRGRILVLDTTTPTPDRDSGSKDTVILLRQLRRQGWHVTFLPENLLDDGIYTAQLRQLGIECLHRPAVTDLMKALTRLAPGFDAILVSRQPLAQQVMQPLKEAAPRAKLIFNTIDLHFLREARAAELFADPAMARRANDTRKAELSSIAAADATLVVSAFEKDLLRDLLPTARVWQMPVRRDLPDGPFPPFEARCGMVFVGGFRHPPNQDAVRWLLGEIWPMAREMGLRAPLYIAGSDAPPFLVDDPVNDVHVLGHVPDLAGLFARCRGSVAPLRYGAGLKGKVIDSLCHGLPVVASPTAAEGSGLEHGRHLLIGETAEELARAIVDLHADRVLWEGLAAAGRAFSGAAFSTEAADRVLSDMLSGIGLQP